MSDGKQHLPAGDPAFVPPKGWDIADASAAGWTWNDCANWARPRTVPFDPQIPMPGREDPPPASPEDYGLPGEPEPIEPRPPERISDKPFGHPYFKCLGFDEGVYFFHSFLSGQVVERSVQSMTLANMQPIAPVAFWSAMFPGNKRPVDEVSMREKLLEECHKVVYDPKVLRGRGAWSDRGRAVLHLGDRLLVDGRTVEIKDFDTSHVYERKVSSGIEIADPASSREAIQLLEICKQARWEEPIFGYLLAGWMFAAPVCGAMKFRPHIYVSGPVGSGKSTIFDQILGEYLKGIAFRTQNKTTEAAIRQALGIDAVPVLMDEAEAETLKARERMQDLFELARGASAENGAPVHKGSVDGRAISYHVRSCFAFASVNLSLKSYADETRTAILKLAAPPVYATDAEKQADAERFAAWERQITEVLTPEFRARMVARAVKLIPAMRANHEVFARAAAMKFGKRRLGDQLGMILAGLYALHTDGIIDDAKAREWIDRHPWAAQIEMAEDSSEQRLQAYLLQSQVRVELASGAAITRTVQELVECAAEMPDADSRIDQKTADDSLRRIGFAVDGYVYVSPKHSWIERRLKDTPWASKWNETLARLPNMKGVTKVIRFKGPAERAQAMPLLAGREPGEA